MKYVRLNNDNMVVEIIPNYALPIEKWYGEEFAKKCVEAPDDISYDMVYNVQTKTFTKRPEPMNETSIQDLQQENKLLKAQLQAQTERSDFIEDCIAEMAGVIYNTEETTT